MIRLLHEHALIDGPPQAVWAILDDADALARVLPGAESIEVTGPGEFRGVLAARLQFLSVRADVQATFRDADPPRHLRLVLDGRPRGLAGSFRVSIPLDLVPRDGPRGPASTTLADYEIELETTGRLATFGAPMLRDTMRRQIAALLANVDRELSARRALEERPA